MMGRAHDTWPVSLAVARRVPWNSSSQSADRPCQGTSWDACNWSRCLFSNSAERAVRRMHGTVPHIFQSVLPRSCRVPGGQHQLFEEEHTNFAGRCFCLHPWLAQDQKEKRSNDSSESWTCRRQNRLTSGRKPVHAPGSLFKHMQFGRISSCQNNMAHYNSCSSSRLHIFLYATSGTPKAESRCTTPPMPGQARPVQGCNGPAGKSRSMLGCACHVLRV